MTRWKSGSNEPVIGLAGRDRSNISLTLARVSGCQNATKLYAAVEAKLSEQRRFVLWWDRQEKRAGSRGIGKKVALQTADASPKIPDFGPDHDTTHRWLTS